MRTLYNFCFLIGWPLVRLWLYARRQAGKEDARRWKERLGIASMPRPEGKLLWCHAASVGESLSLLPLLEALQRDHPSWKMLVTTGTVTSAELMKKRLPSSAIHHYVPVDAPWIVKRFLAHWRPNAALWTESELWPNLVLQTKEAGCPLLLINARMSESSARFWEYMPPLIRPMLAAFQGILAQGEADAARYRKLGAAHVCVLGNLKYAASRLPVDENQLTELKHVIQNRPVWVAASTHAGEEALVIAMHRELQAVLPQLLLILVPRHAERGEEVAALDLTMLRRSKGDRLDANASIYLADTMGELGLWYALASAVFMGGSLVRHGGQNPLEALRFGTPVLTGPHTHNFQEIMEECIHAGVCYAAENPSALKAKLQQLLSDAALRSTQHRAAQAFMEKHHAILPAYLAAIQPMLERH